MEQAGSPPPESEQRILRDQDVPRKMVNIEIVSMTNGWLIATTNAGDGIFGGNSRGRPILVERIPGRDNVAHLLAQLAVLLGDDGG